MTKATAMRNPARILDDNAQRIWFELKEIQVNLPLCTIGGCTRGRRGGVFVGKVLRKYCHLGQTQFVSEIFTMKSALKAK